MTSPDEAPSKTRWVILGLLLAISVITYIDRVNISVTARQMMPALGLTEVQMGEVFSAFVLGYALGQVPGGWLGDRWGPRVVLAIALVWWSIFTALTAVAAMLPIASLLGILGSLVLVRFLMGAGEAAALPNFNRTVANWFPSSERGLGMGIAIGGLGVGSALTPPLTAWIMVNFGWQTAFYIAGAVGLLVAGCWYAYATDRPSDHPHVNRAELDLIAGPGAAPTPAVVPVPWRAFVRTPTVWWLVLSYTCLGYVAYVYLSWFYLYLVNVRGFGLLRGAVYAAAPFVAIAALCPLGGWVTDRMVGKLGINRGRAWVGGLGMLLASASILLGAYTEAPFVALGLLSLGAGWLYFSVGAYWASTVDLSKPHAGTLSGIMNTGANIGGTLSPTLTPWLAEQVGWDAALGTAAAVALLGCVLWLGVKPGDGLREP
ncbi:MAG: MFS transporter [Nitrospirota bacterium]|nr:MFS transporter [Nitrospirota bacterium]